MALAKTAKTFLLSLTLGASLLLVLLLSADVQSTRTVQAQSPETGKVAGHQGTTPTISGTDFNVTYEPKNPKVGEEVTFTITRSEASALLTESMVFDIDFGDAYFGGKRESVEMKPGEVEKRIKHVYDYPSIYARGGSTRYTYKVVVYADGAEKTVELVVRPVLTLSYQPAQPKVGEVVTYCAKIKPGYRKQDLTDDTYMYDLYTISFGDRGSKQATNSIAHFREESGTWNTTCFTHTYAQTGTYTAKVVYTTGVYGNNAAEASVSVSVQPSTPPIPPGLEKLPTGVEEFTLSNGDSLTGLTVLRERGIGYVKIEAIVFGKLPPNSGVTEKTFFTAFTITFFDAQGKPVKGVDVRGVSYSMQIASTTRPEIWRSTLRAKFFDGLKWLTIWNTSFLPLPLTTGLAEARAGRLNIPLVSDGTYVIEGSSKLSVYLPIVQKQQ